MVVRITPKCSWYASRQAEWWRNWQRLAIQFKIAAGQHSVLLPGLGGDTLYLAYFRGLETPAACQRKNCACGICRFSTTGTRRRY